MSGDDIIGTIDNALEDWDVSGDAMRWTPNGATSGRSGDDGRVPVPGTCHPDLEPYAKAVARYDGHHVRLPVPSHPSAFFVDELDGPIIAAPPILTLTKRKAMGPAPFVGDPFLNDARYQWWVWVDDTHRHIAADAELVWRYPR